MNSSRGSLLLLFWLGTSLAGAQDKRPLEYRKFDGLLFNNVPPEDQRFIERVFPLKAGSSLSPEKIKMMFKSVAAYNLRNGCGRDMEAALDGTDAEHAKFRFTFPGCNQDDAEIRYDAVSAERYCDTTQYPRGRRFSSREFAERISQRPPAATLAELARQHQAEGDVILDIQIDGDGGVEKTKVVTGPAKLGPVAEGYVRSLRFEAIPGSKCRPKLPYYGIYRVTFRSREDELASATWFWSAKSPGNGAATGGIGAMGRARPAVVTTQPKTVPPAAPSGPKVIEVLPSKLRSMVVKEVPASYTPTGPVHPLRGPLKPVPIQIEVLVSSDGKVISAKSATSNNAALAVEPALAAVRQWEFSPPSGDGTNVQYKGRILMMVRARQ